MLSEGKVKIEVYVSQGERDILSERAKALHISRAEYLRRVALGAPLPSFGKQQAVLDLVKVHNGLASLGNLLKLTLDNIEADGLPVSTSKINKTMLEINDTKNLLKTKIKEL